MISCPPLAGQACLFDAQPIHINGAISTLFDEGSSIYIGEQFLVIEDDTISVSNVNVVPFENLKQLDKLTECSFEISSDFNPTAFGEIIEYVYAGNNYGISKLDHIRLTDFDRTMEFTFINRQYLYEWINKQDYIGRSTRFYLVDTNSISTLQYVSEDNIVGDLTVTSEPVYETVTEQVLQSSAYDSIVVTPSIFETDYYYFEVESSTCPEAQIEAISEEVLVKDEYLILEVSDAILENVSETVYDVLPYDGAHFYEREFLDLDDLDQINTTNVSITSLDTPCDDVNFIRCAEIQLQKDTITYATDLGNVYPACINGYQNAGRFCYNFDSENSGTLSTRVYPKLVSSASVTSVIVPAEYKTLTYNQITNKNDIDATCIINMTDSIEYQRLIMPAIAEHIDIPAEYSTRVWMRVITPPVFEVDAQEEQIDSIVVDIGDVLTSRTGTTPHALFASYCLHERIHQKLVDQSYISEDSTPLSIEYYNGILQFQKDNQLWMGVIDQQFLLQIKLAY